jgi:hypothetical protein
MTNNLQANELAAFSQECFYHLNEEMRTFKKLRLLDLRSYVLRFGWEETVVRPDENQ